VSQSKQKCSCIQANRQLFPDAFGIIKSRISIKRNAEEKIKGVFLPFTMETKVCTVQFTDREQGSFCFELVGTVQLPSILAEHRFTVDLAKPEPQILPLAPKNSKLEAAKKLFMDSHPLAKNKEQLAFLKGLGKGSGPSGPGPGAAHHLLCACLSFHLRYLWAGKLSNALQGE
jgi:hypothetical protein